MNFQQLCKVFGAAHEVAQENTKKRRVLNYRRALEERNPNGPTWIYIANLLMEFFLAHFF